MIASTMVITGANNGMIPGRGGGYPAPYTIWFPDYVTILKGRSARNSRT